MWTACHLTSFVDLFSAATEEPVIAEPHICGGFPIDESFFCLVLMSDGVYKSIEEATPTDNSNFDVIRLVTEELQCQNNLTGVAQAVVDRVRRAHHDSFMNQMSKCQKRDDMTILIRIFKEEIANCMKSPRATGRQTMTGKWRIWWLLGEIESRLTVTHMSKRSLCKPLSQALSPLPPDDSGLR